METKTKSRSALTSALLFSFLNCFLGRFIDKWNLVFKFDLVVNYLIRWVEKPLG